MILAALVAASTPITAGRAELQAQAEAWNRGDLEGALASYCPTADITWVNKGGVTRGFDAFAEGMRADFSDPARMGQMKVETLDERSLGNGRRLVVIRWTIERDGKRLMGGVSTQLGGSCRGKTRILLEHAS